MYFEPIFSDLNILIPWINVIGFELSDIVVQRTEDAILFVAVIIDAPNYDRKQFGYSTFSLFRTEGE